MIFPISPPYLVKKRNVLEDVTSSIILTDIFYGIVDFSNMNISASVSGSVEWSYPTELRTWTYAIPDS